MHRFLSFGSVPLQSKSQTVPRVWKKRRPPSLIITYTCSALFSWVLQRCSGAAYSYVQIKEQLHASNVRHFCHNKCLLYWFCGFLPPFYKIKLSDCPTQTYLYNLKCKKMTINNGVKCVMMMLVPAVTRYSIDTSWLLRLSFLDSLVSVNWTLRAKQVLSWCSYPLWSLPAWL